MGYVLVFGPCYACNTVFGYNPTVVPSVTPPGGSERMPLCRTCIERVNPQRIKNGLPPIIPHPEAYEPVDENEVPWE